MTGCAGEFNRVYKSTDYDYRYEYAKQCFAEGRYVHAVNLLQELVTALKGGDNAQESLYMLGMAQYMSRDYESASQTFKKYGSSYPKGMYAEKASFYVGESLYESAPEHQCQQREQLHGLHHHSRECPENLPLHRLARGLLDAHHEE